jgi:hypothetical protein
VSCRHYRRRASGRHWTTTPGTRASIRR